MEVTRKNEVEEDLDEVKVAEDENNKEVKDGLEAYVKSQKIDLFVFALTGQFGAGVTTASKIIEQYFKKHDTFYPLYSSLSEYILTYASELAKEDFDGFKNKTDKKTFTTFQENCEEVKKPNIKPHDKRRKMQHMGSFIRLIKEPAFLPLFSFVEASKARRKEKKPVVLIIDGIKNSSELKILREIYGKSLISFSILAPSDTRFRRLVLDKGWHENDKSSYEELDLTDSRQYTGKDKDKKYGQEVRKVCVDSDVFIINNETIDVFEKKIIRYIKLFLNPYSIKQATPDEYGMMLAYSSGACSTCISRQVGASILTKSGKIIATGCNEAPNNSGGFFNEDKKDNRCFKDKRCFNTSMVHRIRKPKGNPECNTICKNITEYCRAVHAEMSALLSATNLKDYPKSDLILYSTTYPCQNCAKHILLSGIKKVVYIEPYPKSKAQTMFPLDIKSTLEEQFANKLNLVQYEGVAPKRYLDVFFRTHSIKQDDGSINLPSDAESNTPIYDSYKKSFDEFEKIFERDVEKILK